MLRVFSNTARYVDQGGGRRKGSFAIYLSPWHADIEGTSAGCMLFYAMHWQAPYSRAHNFATCRLPGPEEEPRQGGGART